MDPQIIEDTAPFHWSLDQQQTMEFLAKLYPDSRLLPSNVAFNATSNIEYIMSNMQATWHWLNDRWAYFPDLTGSKPLEERIAEFFNGVIRHVPHSYMCTRRWTGKAANNLMDGFSSAIRKPDLLLCEEGVIWKRVAQKEKFDAKTDIYSIGEVKQKYDEDHKKDSYVELAGNAAFLLEAQDGRCAVPSIQLLGSSIILTLFDRGGSISTYPLDIHLYPKQFLRILLGVTFADGTMLGFDSTITPTQNSQKTIRIVKQGQEYHVLVDTLLSSSFSLHSRSATMWIGKVTIDQEEQDVVIKDSWVDPLRRYTEGRILKMLEDAGVKGVPILVHEQQVQTPHPITRELVNHSTHILRTLFHGSSQTSYYLRVLSRLVSKPRGYSIFDFSSLAELLVGLVDCLCAHRDALKRAHILHRDISLFSLLLVLAMHSDVGEGFLDRVLKRPEKDVVRAKIQKLPRRGLLADWDYAVTTNDSDSRSANPPQSDATGATGIHISGEAETVSRTSLKDTHNILIPVADEPIPSDASSSIDTSPLHRTGTWAWMAAELSHIGPDTPVVHRAHHDLESFFYVLLAICLLYDEPAKLKPAKVLCQCFDPFFAITKPSPLNIVTIQSNFGWTAHMLPYVSSYFQPLIPLLEKIRKELILPIKMHGGKLQANQDFTHDHFIDDIVTVLAKLPGSSWVPKMPNTRKGVVQDGSVSNTSSPPVTPSTPPSAGMVLPEVPLPRPPMVRMPGASSTNSSKRCSEHEDESGSRAPKRQKKARDAAQTATTLP